MNSTEFEQFCNDAEISLQQAVRDALDRKRRLGQSAVVVENGEVIEIGPEEIALRLDALAHRDRTTQSQPLP